MARVSKTVAGIEFVADISTKVVGGVEAVSTKNAHRFEVEIGQRLIERGIVNGEAFAFIRKAAKLRATELASMLDVDARTIGRFDAVDSEIPRPVWVVLAGLFAERIGGKHHVSVVAALDAAASPRRPRQSK